MGLANDLALGERIVRVRSGCAHCHGVDLSGKEIIDDPAIGKVFSSNLTPQLASAPTLVQSRLPRNLAIWCPA